MAELEWEDTVEVLMDETMMFGLGYDFDGWEHSREECETPLGRFAVWPDNLGERAKWNYYGGYLGYYAGAFSSREEAQNAVERLIDGC